MLNQLTLKNLDECLDAINSRGDLPVDLYMDFSSGDIWVPDYPQEHVYNCHFCDAVSLIHEFPACDLKTYRSEDIEAICQKAYGEFVVVHI